MDNKFYSFQTKQHFVELYFSGMSYRQVAAYYAKNYPENKKPHHSLIQKIVEKFKKTGSVGNIKPPGRPPSATNGENSAEVIRKIMVIFLILKI